MSDDQDNAQKTEEPTQKKIDDAIKKGQVAFSREVTSFIMLLFLTVFIIWFAPGLIKTANIQLSHYITQPHNFEMDYEGDDILRLAIKIIIDVGYLLMIPLAISVIGVLLSSFIQNGIIYAPEAIVPDFSKVSPMKGFKRIFSMKSVVELVKGLLKISLITLVVYNTIKGDLDSLSHLQGYSYAGILELLMKLVTKSMLSICVVMGSIAVFDVIYQRMEHTKNLRMTKQEVKDEMKQSEGNPEIKAKLRALRIERSKKRMMAEVPKADVIITNPTHFSIAIQYDRENMPAPKIIAKGVDKVALKIREIARDKKIPIVENKILARSLYDLVDLDDFIHVEHYEAVANIISKVMNIQN
jgi:flagellar biosynthetic protein FlhB